MGLWKDALGHLRAFCFLKEAPRHPRALKHPNKPWGFILEGGSIAAPPKRLLCFLGHRAPYKTLGLPGRQVSSFSISGYCFPKLFHLLHSWWLIGNNGARAWPSYPATFVSWNIDLPIIDLVKKSQLKIVISQKMQKAFADNKTTKSYSPPPPFRTNHRTRGRAREG